MTSAVQYRDIVTSSYQTTSSTVPHCTGDRMTLTEFASQYVDEFPTKFVVCKGFYGPNNDLKISDGDRFKAHSLSQMPVVNIEYDNGRCENISVDCTIPFAILYNPQNNHSEAIMGYKYEKVSDLVQLPVLPPILWSRKAYRGSSPESSISANEILIVRRVKSRLVGKQQLKVYSLTQKKEKTLYTSCVGNFSTKPRDVSLYLCDILKYMPDIFPCRAVMFNSETVHTPGNAVPVSMRTGSCLVTMTHSSINTLLRVSSSLGKGFEANQTKYLDVPIDLGIMVRRDTSSEDAEQCNGNIDDVYEDASMYNRFDNQQPHPPNSSVNLEPVSNQRNHPQLYTNVHFGQEVMRRANHSQISCTSVPQALESGHYQTPTSLKVRTSSDPISIGSIQQPSNDTLPGNYVLLSSADRGGSAGSGGSSGSGGLGEAKGPGSWERNSPRNSMGNGSPSYRPPLPPPNRVRKSQQQQQRTPGYDYVDTNPIRSARVFNEIQQIRPSENGEVQSDANPDYALSLSSAGSGGSGGAVVERKFSDVHAGRPYPHPGSGDGVVERSMRTSSINTTGYSYTKTNPHPAPNHTPNPTSSKSSGYYSHLRSRSGPPVTPQLPPLSAQVMQQQQQQRTPTVIATTRLDSDSESLVVVQRQVSAPMCARGKGYQPSESGVGRCESASVGFTAKERPDSLSVVMDDLAKMTQELEETAFLQDSSEDISPSETRKLQISQESLTASCNPPPSQGTTSTKDLSPEVIEKHRAYLISMDNYQILSLLEMMGLEQYTPTFKQEQINGDILSTCDDALLRDELKVTSRLHRMRLLRVIEGTYSVHEIMSGKDGYIFMSSAGKQ